MTDQSNVVNIANVTVRTLHSGPRFELGWASVSQLIGTTQIGASLHVVPAGKTAWPFHRHHGKDELFFILSGSGTYRVGGRRMPISAGDCIGAPAGGEAHQIVNSSDAELRYIAFSSLGRADVIDYPDSGKMAVKIVHGNDRDPPSILDIEGQFTPSTGYWDGEDLTGKS